MITKVVVDGNDGTGKTATINKLKALMPNIEFEDRGIFSEATLDDELFDNRKNIEKEKEFYRKVANSYGTLFVIVDADPKVCQKRILERGDSIEEEYHNMDDLKKYRDRFWRLVDMVDRLQNVMVIDTTNREPP